jgi:molecular chaperone GrpE (heat shock protein)
MHFEPASTVQPEAQLQPSPHDDQDPDLIARLAGIDATLAEVSERLGAEADRAAARERVIDRQYADIERLRAVERAGVMRPMITDLCRLRNNLRLQAATVPDTITKQQVAVLLGSFAGDVEDTLDRCGVAVMECGPGGRFVAGQHQLSRFVDDAVDGLDGTIAEVVHDGYVEIQSGRVIAPARVTVHRSVANATPTDTPTKETSDG